VTRQNAYLSVFCSSCHNHVPAPLSPPSWISIAAILALYRLLWIKLVSPLIYRDFVYTFMNTQRYNLWSRLSKTYGTNLLKLVSPAELLGWTIHSSTLTCKPSICQLDRQFHYHQVRFILRIPRSFIHLRTYWWWKRKFLGNELHRTTIVYHPVCPRRLTAATTK
jgi:hypothetical protein